MSQLLQRTPPAALTAEQEAQLFLCCNLINQLAAALEEAPSLKMQLVDAMLKQQVACNVGSLVTWVQQQPEQQLVVTAVVGNQGSAPVTCTGGSTTGIVWTAAVHLLAHFAVVAFQHIRESAGACNMAASLTQQLEQSGKARSRSCTCTIWECCGCHDSACRHLNASN
jgi:hypothetical protein